MVFDMELKLALKRARLALRCGNLDDACRLLSQAPIRELKEGQELCYALADALCARAEEHSSCANFPEALLDLTKAEAGCVRTDEVAELRGQSRTVAEAELRQDNSRRLRIEAARRRIERG